MGGRFSYLYSRLFSLLLAFHYTHITHIQLCTTMTVLPDNNDQGIPVFMIGRSAENGKEILPALAPDFDSTHLNPMLHGLLVL